jgi:hypothetical protein
MIFCLKPAGKISKGLGCLALSKPCDAIVVVVKVKKWPIGMLRRFNGFAGSFMLSELHNLIMSATTLSFNILGYLS